MNIQPDGFLELRAPEKSQTPTRFIISGDTCFRSFGEDRILRGEAPRILAPIKPFLGTADLSAIQFETVLTTADTPIPKSGPNLKSNPLTLDFIREWNGNLCLMANNHTGDFGPQALIETKRLLRENGFQTVGAGDNLEQAYEPAFLDHHSRTIGILNICENEFGGATETSAGSAPLNPTLNVRQIMDLKRKAEVVMVIVHGGNETYPFPSPRVVNMLRTFADVGADAVVSIHTHCPQGIEVWHGKPIVYSLGNFYFPYAKDDIATYDPENFWYTGYSVAFDLDSSGCFRLEVCPSHFEPDASTVHPLTPAQKQGFMDYLNEISRPLSDLSQIRKYHEAWCAASGYVNSIINPSWQKEDFDCQDFDHLKKVSPLRNLFTCEAHHELLATYFRLHEQGRVQEAMALRPEIQRLQKASFMKL